MNPVRHGMLPPPVMVGTKPAAPAPAAAARAPDARQPQVGRRPVRPVRSPQVAARGRTVPGVSGSSRLVRNLVVLLSSQVVIWAVTFASNVFVPRALGPARMGELTVATTVGMILDTVFTLGYGALMVKEIARDHSRAPSLIGAALSTRALLLVPAAAAVAAVTLALHASRELSELIWLAAAGTFVGLFIGPFTATFQALERMEYPAYGNVLIKGVVAVASVALVVFGFGPAHILALAFAVSALVLLLCWHWSRPLFRIDWRWSWPRARFLVVGSLPYWTSALVLSFYMWVDALMLSAMTPIHVVGWYSVPTRLFAALLFFPLMLGTAYLPRLSRAYAAGTEALGREARALLQLALSASLPITAGLLLVAWQLVWVLYGPAYTASVPVLMVVALCLPATYLNIVANQVLVAANGQVYWTWVMVGAAIVNPIANLFLIRLTQDVWSNGALGAAFALLLTEAGMAVAALVLVAPLLRWSVAARVARAGAATAGMSLVVWLVAQRFGLTPMVVSGAVSFPLLAAAFGVLAPAEIREARRLGAGFLGRLRPAGNGR